MISVNEGLRQMSDGAPVIVWFRQDLRVADNPALHHAVETGRPVLPVYIHDDATPNVRALGAAQKWWLHHALGALQSRLRELGARLILREGAAGDVLNALVEESGAAAVHWNRRYDRQGRAIDAQIKTNLKDRGIEAVSFAGHLMHEPAKVETKSGGFFKVYTPFWRAFRAGAPPRDPFPAPGEIRGAGGNLASADLTEWRLLPTKPDWSTGFSEWTPGEAGARARLDTFAAEHLDGYVTGRDAPGRDVTSKLSPHLRFGDISPYQVWAKIDEVGDEVPAKDEETFRKELVWREFNHHLLFHFGELERNNVAQKFDAFPWRYDEGELKAWQQGRTGYPIVDAGMRQLWRTGWMHNRLRMITGSFLVKHLLHDWREGERWFWDCLVDGDPANNPGNWQWVAGTGADASPYFRIFNPLIQGPKFDPDGDYVREWVPELADMPAEHVHAPWEAPDDVLENAGVTLGETYPWPIVDHKFARSRALAALEEVKQAA